MKKVILFLCQGVEEYEASVFTDALGWTTTYGLEPIELVTVGLRSKVKCAWNFTIEPEFQLSEKRQTQMKEMGVNIIQQPVVIDKNIITSRSPSAAMDVAFAVVEKLTSTANLNRIKEGMGFIEKSGV